MKEGLKTSGLGGIGSPGKEKGAWDSGALEKSRLQPSFC